MADYYPLRITIDGLELFHGFAYSVRCEPRFDGDILFINGIDLTVGCYRSAGRTLVIEWL
jgi:hypothetical protein